ncbi:MAG: hypothetical protein HDR21_13585 [Lachnospiraceae bacterium]|nr:hypothetical protein [Lachnospiraceae bacterium]
MPDKGKKILILGNGFDLAHGLPTKYSHFLEFCYGVEKIWAYGTSDEKHKNVSIKDVLVKELYYMLTKMTPKEIYEITCKNPKLIELHRLLYDNIWYNYFIEIYRKNSMKGENWIDFESEIRFIIKEVDQRSLSLTNLWEDLLKEFMDPLTDFNLRIFCNKLTFDQYMIRKKWKSNHKITIKDFREKTFEDLERLTRALELYLTIFIEKIPVSQKIPEISNLSPDYVINFNYTDTYERIYKKENVYHIHGKADMKRPANENNMVLGIDEYWSEDERDERTNFTIFKKFAQRIQKHTGNESYKYLDEIQKLFKAGRNSWSGSVDLSKNHPDCVSHVYVFGHSLDVTDKDVLSSFIGDDSTSVTVYCMDKGTERELIANTIKLIGEKKLLDKSNHVPPKLNYVISKKRTYNT